MGSSFCKYENKERCELLHTECVPMQKGCVLSKLKTDKPGLKIDSRKYKSKDIARFR